MSTVNCAILGATSYTGLELVRLLDKHQNARVTVVSSQTYAGQRLSDVFPVLKGVCDARLLSPQDAAGRAADVVCVFSCLPHAVSAQLLLPFIEKGIKTVDLSADFRLRDPSVYAQWYGGPHPRPELLGRAVFGMPEQYRDAISQADIVANPGCYPTSVLLPLLPLLKAPGTELTAIIADSKSGVSGAGRSLKLASHFVEANENLSAYGVGRAHRHVPEMEQELSAAAGGPVTLTFVPHLVPVNRGILSTLYISTNRSARECGEIVGAAYAGEPFVRVRSGDDLPKLADVCHTNYCDIAFAGGDSGMPVVAVSAIDNLVKGASGQAIQNMNVMFGFDETMGLS
ncbi:MAG: N-acetyl-gamma-glutamyl-phosphate reductase [Chitinivibrionales bacterium]|nr:N-acetyl-gamma-glutamyl-phosphate reductase [Chitinivibrionales bacterium]MBD3395827.1 N-acetyl-gamma-glutamyl-phosphate reductase [Chitinivibrionales bacterium]